MDGAEHTAGRVAGRQFTRYRAYVVAILVVAAIAFGAPGLDGGGTAVDVGDTQFSGGSAASGDAGGALTVDESAVEVGSGEASGSAVGATVTAPGEVTAGSASSPEVVAAAATAPGIGSSAALANPRCDPERKRIKFPAGYAPPCVVPWPKGADNGGSTHPGVDDKTIRVIWYQEEEDENDQRIIREAFNIFDKQYELWGRRLDLQFFVGTGDDEVAQRADALKVALDMKPFVVTGQLKAGGEVFATELAKRGIVHVSIDVPHLASQQQAPFRWGSSSDDRFTIVHATEFVGKRLKGRPAQWAGDPAYTARPRQFAVIYPVGWDKRYFDQRAAEFGINIVDAAEYDPDDLVETQERARVMLSRFKAKGATSIILGSDVISNVFFSREATNQVYFPEWILTGASAHDAVIIGRLNDQQQWSHAFGTGPLPPFVQNGEQGVIDAMYSWQYGRTMSPADAITFIQAYVQAMPIATCAMLAGPGLTGQTYRDGCFAFPPSEGAFCGCVSATGRAFGRHAFPWDYYALYNDMTEKWWDPDEVGPDEFGVQAAGVYMKVDGGKRYLPGQWPTTPPKAFDPNGALDAFTEWPPGEEPPTYKNENPG